MAEEPEKSSPEPNLELPSVLGFGRRKRRRARDVAEDPATGPVPAESSEGSDPRDADPVEKPGGGLAPAAGTPKRKPPVPPPSRSASEPVRPVQAPPPPPATEEAPPPATEETTASTATPEPRVEEPHAEEPRPTDPVLTRSGTQEPPVEDPAPVRPAVVEPPPEATTQDEPTRIEHSPDQPVGWPAEEPVEVPEAPHAAPVDRPEAEPRQLPLGWPEDNPDGTESTGGADSADSALEGEQERWPHDAPGVAPGARRAKRERRGRGTGEPFTLPAVTPRVAAVVSGLLAGLLGVLLTFLAARGCEVLRGVGSCGRIGLLALLVIVGVEVLAGAVLLKAWRISDPVSTSFLGVGLVAMFVLLFLMGSLESMWMALVIPLLTAGAFLFSWWVTVSFAEEPKDTLFR